MGWGTSTGNFMAAPWLPQQVMRESRLLGGVSSCKIEKTVGGTKQKPVTPGGVMGRGNEGSPDIEAQKAS